MRTCIRGGTLWETAKSRTAAPAGPKVLRRDKRRAERTNRDEAAGPGECTVARTSTSSAQRRRRSARPRTQHRRDRKRRTRSSLESRGGPSARRWARARSTWRQRVASRSTGDWLVVFRRVPPFPWLPSRPPCPSRRHRLHLCPWSPWSERGDGRCEMQRSAARSSIPSLGAHGEPPEDDGGVPLSSARWGEGLARSRPSCE